MSETPFETRCDILSDLWIEYKEEPQFRDFVSYNDLGLPLAFLVSEDLVTPNDKAIMMVNETFVLLLRSLEIEEDAGFDSLDDLLMG